MVCNHVFQCTSSPEFWHTVPYTSLISFTSVSNFAVCSDLKVIYHYAKFLSSVKVATVLKCLTILLNTFNAIVDKLISLAQLCEGTSGYYQCCDFVEIAFKLVMFL